MKTGEPSNRPRDHAPKIASIVIAGIFSAIVLTVPAQAFWNNGPDTFGSECNGWIEDSGCAQIVVGDVGDFSRSGVDQITCRDRNGNPRSFSLAPGKSEGVVQIEFWVKDPDPIDPYGQVDVYVGYTATDTASAFGLQGTASWAWFDGTHAGSSGFLSQGWHANRCRGVLIRTSGDYVGNPADLKIDLRYSGASYEVATSIEYKVAVTFSLGGAFDWAVRAMTQDAHGKKGAEVGASAGFGLQVQISVTASVVVTVSSTDVGLEDGIGVGGFVLGEPVASYVYAVCHSEVWIGGGDDPTFYAAIDSCRSVNDIQVWRETNACNGLQRHWEEDCAGPDERII